MHLRLCLFENNNFEITLAAHNSNKFLDAFSNEEIQNKNQLTKKRNMQSMRII